MSRKQTKTLLKGWMPIILLSANDGAVRYDFTLWATPLPTVKDWKKALRLAHRRGELSQLDYRQGDQHRRRARPTRK